MGLALAQSYTKVRNQIKSTGSCWVQSANGKWHHTFDKTTVKDRLKGLNAEIERFISDSPNPLYNWEGL